jgi:hypothetical protein
MSMLRVVGSSDDYKSECGLYAYSVAGSHRLWSNFDFGAVDTSLEQNTTLERSRGWMCRVVLLWMA